jgi:hypothetical protein
VPPVSFLSNSTDPAPTTTNPFAKIIFHQQNVIVPTHTKPIFTTKPQLPLCNSNVTQSFSLPPSIPAEFFHAAIPTREVNDFDSTTSTTSNTEDFPPSPLGGDFSDHSLAEHIDGSPAGDVERVTLACFEKATDLIITRSPLKCDGLMKT